MAQNYEIRLKASALENLKRSRDELRAQLGTRQIGERLTGLAPGDAGELANRLLGLLDAIDGVISRAKAAD